MKKMITKMMGILMAAVMIFGLMPGLTQVAHAAETIKNVAVTGFVKPETSATAITIDALSVPADAPYSIKRISWESSDIVPAEGGFQFDDISGERVYRLIIKLEADSGYSFASISQFESYTLNGGTELLDKCEIDSDGFFRMYTKWYTPVAPEMTTISSVSLTVTEPTAGAPVPSYIVDVNNAGVSAESGANYTVVESGWLQNDGAGGSEYTTDTEFQAGKTYLLFATLSPNEGYQFSEECTGKVNGLDPEDYYRRDPDLIVYKEFTVPDTPATYMITVTNGKAYSDEACTTEVTSASEGTRIYFKTDTPPAGKFGITGVFPSTVEISYIYDVPSFLMPGEDVTINTLFADQIPYTVDLTTNTADGSKLVSEMRMACEQGVVSSPDHSASVYKIDLDNNGDLDISFNQAYTKEMTVLESTNLHGDYTITVAEAMYSPITFKFPDTTPVTEYPVWVGDTQVTSANKDDILSDGGKAKFDPDTNTLTLNNPTVSGSHADGIICYNPSSDDPELLKITGSATLGDGSTFAGILGIESAIELNGTFDVTGTECGVEAFNVTISGGTVTAHGGVSGIATYKDISITGGTVNATGDTKYGIGSDTKSVSISGGTVAVKGGKAGIDAENNIIITGGTVNAESVDAGTDAITAGGDISISNADVTAHGDGGGIYADGKMSISGNSVKASGLYCGIEAFGDISITGGTVEAVSSNVDYPAIKSSSQITIGEGLEIITPEGGKISDDKKSIVNPDGTAALDVLIKAGEVPFVEYDVWVGSTRVTSANKDDILGDGGKAKYDPDTNTLTLNDPTVTGSYEGAKIYAKAMTLTVTGKVTLSGADFGIDVRGYSGYLGRLIITGNGTNIDAAGNTSGISAKDGVIINGGTIRASGSVAGISSATISISGEANVTATASAEPESYGIYASSGIGIFDATVTATAGDGIGATGIYSKAGDITISGGTVTVTAGAGGIYAYDGEVKIENGTAKVEATVGTVAVRGKNGITIGDELMIKLPEGGTVESNSGSYDIMDGSSVARHALIVPKEATTYTVTFDVNGHGTAPAAQTVEDGKTATKPADPTETGWTFGGWYKEAACTNAFDFSTPITADIMLYAKWTEESVTPGVITYTVVSGGDSTWTKDSTSTITITVKRSEADDTCFSHFSSVQIDGTTLATGDYEAKAGSTVITLKAATLQKLSTGSHTITVIFDDGKAETSVTVKAAASPADSKSPKTGDSNHMGLWIILMIISVIWLGTAVLIRKKNRYTSKH